MISPRWPLWQTGRGPIAAADALAVVGARAEEAVVAVARKVVALAVVAGHHLCGRQKKIEHM